MGRCWRLPGGRARFGFGRPVRRATLLGSLLAWARGGCSPPGSGCGCAAPVLWPRQGQHPAHHGKTGVTGGRHAGNGVRGRGSGGRLPPGQRSRCRDPHRGRHPGGAPPGDPRRRRLPVRSRPGPAPDPPPSRHAGTAGSWPNACGAMAMRIRKSTGFSSCSSPPRCSSSPRDRVCRRWASPRNRSVNCNAASGHSHNQADTDLDPGVWESASAPGLGQGSAAEGSEAQRPDRGGASALGQQSADRTLGVSCLFAAFRPGGGGLPAWEALIRTCTVSGVHVSWMT